MDYKVILSPRAIQDLQEIVRYTAWDSPKDAEQFGNRLIDERQSLSSLPERGRVVPEFKNPEIRELILKSYRIVYRVKSAEKVVEISRFWHAARGAVGNLT